jgi:deazaflavin-dependent oxidoreductase (nitroreductase family)
MDVLLMHNKGAKSGTEHTTPVAYARDADRYVVFASKAGAPTNPGWYHNLIAHPEITIEVGDQTLEVTVSELEGEERERIFARQTAAWPTFAEYAEKAGSRVIPVIALTPKSG